jgi:hypothetical protein
MSITASDEETDPQSEAVHAGSDGWMLVAPASPEQADSRLRTNVADDGDPYLLATGHDG